MTIIFIIFPILLLSVTYLRNSCLPPTDDDNLDFPQLYGFSFYVYKISVISQIRLCEAGVKVNIFLCWYLVIPEPFVENIVLYLLGCFGAFVETYDYICEAVLLGSLFCSFDLLWLLLSCTILNNCILYK